MLPGESPPAMQSGSTHPIFEDHSNHKNQGERRGAFQQAIFSRWEELADLYLDTPSLLCVIWNCDGPVQNDVQRLA
jgi:hypothetical protein